MTRNVLIIDDDREDIAIFCEALLEIDKDITCEFVANSRHAVEKVLCAEIVPDLIFLDLNMPMVDGWDVLKELKSNETSRSIPVIIFSTSPLDRELLRARQSGASGFLSKPDDYLELTKGLRTIIDAANRREMDTLSPLFLV